ncbi:glycerate kinase [Bradyrhizobium sp. BRP14]|nr:glycerate kinase [Bradyrhizobium sp. BRP14]
MNADVNEYCLRKLPVIALAGTIGKRVRLNFEHGIDAFASILKRPCSLDEAIENADKLLTRAAEDAVRMVSVGIGLARMRRKGVRIAAHPSSYRDVAAANGASRCGDYRH